MRTKELNREYDTIWVMVFSNDPKRHMYSSTIRLSHQSMWEEKTKSAEITEGKEAVDSPSLLKTQRCSACAFSRVPSIPRGV